MAVRVQQEDFDVGFESRALQQPTVGAIALFVGTVRSLSEDNCVTAMTIEHFEFVVVVVSDFVVYMPVEYYFAVYFAVCFEVLCY